MQTLKPSKPKLKSFITRMHHLTDYYLTKSIECIKCNQAIHLFFPVQTKLSFSTWGGWGDRLTNHNLDQPRMTNLSSGRPKRVRPIVFTSKTKTEFWTPLNCFIKENQSNGRKSPLSITATNDYCSVTKGKQTKTSRPLRPELWMASVESSPVIYLKGP